MVGLRGALLSCVTLSALPQFTESYAKTEASFVNVEVHRELLFQEQSQATQGHPWTKVGNNTKCSGVFGQVKALNFKIRTQLDVVHTSQYAI